MPTPPPPPPLVPDFPAGFVRLLVGVGSQPFQFEHPGFADDGSVGHYVLKHSPIEAATNPEAIYPDHSSISHDQWATSMQLKLTLMSLMWQLFNDFLGLGLAEQPGPIIPGGTQGSWPVVPL